MWMQDKPLRQEELGRTISQLVHAFQTAEAQHLFLQTFWQTMNREWPGIDRLRLDKFYMLMRMVLNESLKAVKAHAWEERQIEQLLELLTTEILHPDSQAPNGVKNHFTEIFLEELSKVGAKELTADQTLLFIEPFCRIAASTKDSLVLHNITRGIFETIVEQAPLAIEDLEHDLEDEEEEDEEEEEEEEDEGEEQEGESSEAESQQDLRSERPPAGSTHGADPGAGQEPAGDSGDSEGPVLQFDYEAVANRLFEMASRESTPSLNRKRLYKVVRKLQDLAGGIFPEDDVPEEAYRKLLEGKRERKRKKQQRRQSRSPLQKQKGKEAAASDPDPSPRVGRKRSRRKGRGAEPTARSGGRPARVGGTASREQPSGACQGGAHKRRRPRQAAGARAKVAGVQEPKKKKKRTLASGE
ncbi:ribosomal RNA processing protein 1 homolog A isoform X2 [Lepus europaeus]|nr:ribosomal RNA processing protein 1 homolog A isoform X2 [Lepus europaeus]